MMSNIGMKGNLSTRVVRAQGPGLGWKARNMARWGYVWGLLTNGAARLFSALTGIPTMTAVLSAVVERADGTRVNYGVLSRRVVTTAFANYVAGQLTTDSTAIGDFKFHDSGVGTGAEAAGDTDMGTTDGESRVSGSQSTTNNVYTTVGTISYTTTKAITEHGVFNASTSGTLMDRSVFSAINVVNGDSIQFTYALTVNSGG